MENHTQHTISSPKGPGDVPVHDNPVAVELGIAPNHGGDVVTESMASPTKSTLNLVPEANTLAVLPKARKSVLLLCFVRPPTCPTNPSACPCSSTRPAPRPDSCSLSPSQRTCTSASGTRRG